LIASVAELTTRVEPTGQPGPVGRLVPRRHDRAGLAERQQVGGRAERRDRVEVSGVGPQVGEHVEAVDDLALGVGADVEPHEGHPQADVGLGDGLADQVPLVGQPPIDVDQRVEETGAGGQVLLAFAGRQVGALVDRRADPLVERVDLLGQRRRIGLDDRSGQVLELRGQIDADGSELVAGHRGGRPVPQRRHGHVAVEAGLGGVVGLPEQGEAVDRIGAVGLAEGPPPSVAPAVDVGERDDVLQASQAAGDHHPLRPRAEPPGVDVVAAGLGGERRRAVGPDAPVEAVQRTGVIGVADDAVLAVGGGVDGAGEDGGVGRGHGCSSIHDATRASTPETLPIWSGFHNDGGAAFRATTERSRSELEGLAHQLLGPGPQGGGGIRIQGVAHDPR
jgi:hypothetical protein